MACATYLGCFNAEVASLDSVRARADALASDVLDLYRQLHRFPELGLNLPETQRLVLDSLGDLPLSLHVGSTTSAVVAVLRAPRPVGPPLLLRADMDALPLEEETELPFRSTRSGAMHACGHDGHTAMLLIAARVLAEMQRQLPVDVLFFFQAGEEGHDGCRKALADGLLEGDRTPSRVFALHLTNSIPSGIVTTRGGAVLAGADGLSITMAGRGGHAGLPHQAIDPVPALCSAVAGIQQWLARRIDAFDPAIVTVNRLDAGVDGAGLIPETATARGTIRTFSEATRERVWEGLQELGEHIGAAYGCRAQVTITPGYPPTVNDPAQAAWALDVAARTVGQERAVQLSAPVFASEDFSYLLQRHPGAMLFLGAAPPSPTGPMHSPRMLLDEAALPTGVAVLAALAMAPTSA